MDNKIINGVWGSPRLTNIEKLSIRSFQDNGHEYHLWVTGSVEGVPEGTTVHNVGEVVPPDSPNWFSTPIHFCDYFRYNLINKIGGWYVDVDVVCLKPFDHAQDYVIIAEDANGGPTATIDFRYLSSCTFKAPPQCRLLKTIVEEIERRNPRNGCGLPPRLRDINDGNGPPMFRKWVPKLRLAEFIHPPYAFDALDYKDYHKFVSSGHKLTFPEESYAIHLRSSFWRCGDPMLVPDKKYPEDSLYEQLKMKHGVQ